MTTGNVYLDLFIGGLLGQLFHVLVIKLPALKKRATDANTTFNPAQYFKDDWLALTASLVTILICIFLFDEITGAYPSIVKYAKFFFIFVGYTGSSVLLGALSRADKKIQKVVDTKTNIADHK